MIKLYDLVFEDIEKNDIDLGDKTQEFNEKLELMSPKLQNVLIGLVTKLNDTEKKELGSLINKYPDIKGLESPKTPLEKKIALLQVQRVIGPGEILFHLELQDSSMVGDTSHDLMVKGKVWEIKFVKESGGPFNPAKLGKITNFPFSRNLYNMVFFLDKVTAALPKLEEDFEDISPELLDALRKWNTRISNKFSPAQAIYQGELGRGIRDFMIDLIKIIKDEIEINTDDEFTTVKFGGINVTPKDKGIDPVSIQNIDNDSVTLNFIGKNTIKVLEILNELPYAREGDFQTDIDDSIKKVLEGMPSMIIWSNNGKMAIIDKDELVDKIVFDNITQNTFILKVEPKFWSTL
tara:strand:+ start:93 stop:1139 length:1047 start_codon:yes stop_codon:yes gene_type:complete